MKNSRQMFNMFVENPNIMFLLCFVPKWGRSPTANPTEKAQKHLQRQRKLDYKKNKKLV